MAFWKKKTQETENEKSKEMNYELPELPQLPDIAQIKSAQEFSLETDKTDMLPELPDIYQSSSKPEDSDKSLTSEIPISKGNFNLEEEKTEEREKIGKIKGPIYIKVEKFKEALANFEIIRRKIKEVETLLHKIKEIKVKEQEELDIWEKELEEVKGKLAAIDDKLFSKLD